MGYGSALRLIGAGGHARVAAAAWQSAGGFITGFHDDRPSTTPGLAQPILGSVNEAKGTTDLLHIAVGDNSVRKMIAETLAGQAYPILMHTTAWVSDTANVGAGSLLCAGAVVQPDATIGEHCIINSLGLVEHDCQVGDFVHVAPGARLAGGVRIGTGALIGIGACVIPGISIGAGAVVGAGAIVIQDIGPGQVVAGNPARPLS